MESWLTQMVNINECSADQEVVKSQVPVAHAYNLSYLFERLRVGGSRFKANLGKQFARPHLQEVEHLLCDSFVNMKP
jgi:hypothetical protein